ncbi:hypothetical protein FJY68_06420 [candidate division WOR-3 bacterium]|uniref:Uncharacterized protein n=1 Tax=candidate division WOR-3 bacterium TaxID=2052148 RepID=A0A937XDM5_UNCW3|nr:hypothetical protein [candidate division WOR-3 bacterium]
MSASAITSAGEDLNLRRWRTTLTVAAWVLIVQSGATFVTGLIGLLLAPLAAPRTMFGQLGTVLDRSQIAMIQTLVGQTLFLNRIQTVGSLVLLAGSIGLLLRRKWGWYVVVLVHVAATVAVFVWVMPMFDSLFRALDPHNASTMAWLLTVLSALAPAVVVAFLLLRPVVSQFEKQGPRIRGV